MPKFPKNTGFKLPGIGSREIDTPGNFRKSQKVEDVGYCDNTDSHMLPPGSSPLLATDEPKDWLVPDYYHTTYTSSVGDPEETERETVEPVNEITPRGVDLPTPEIKADIPNIPVPPKIKSSKVTYKDLYNESIASGMSKADAQKVVDEAKNENWEKFGTHQVTELHESSKGKKGFDTSFDYMGDDRDEAMRKKRKKMGY